jgi:hypothetical protein
MLLGPLLAKPPMIIHFFPKPFPATVFDIGPTVEMATLFNTDPHFLSNVEEFTEAAKYAEGYYGHAFGEVSEELEQKEGSGKGKAVVLCIGWQATESHMKFKETQIFKDNVHFMTDGMGGVEIVSFHLCLNYIHAKGIIQYHVKFKKY